MVTPRTVPKRHWLAAVALLAMVFNQAAFAAHLCLGESHSSPSVAENQAPSSAAIPQLSHPHDCPHARGMVMDEPGAGAWCAAHCAHVTDASQQAKAPVVPAMLVVAPELACPLCGTAESARISPINARLPTVERRLVVFPSFQI